MPILLILSGCLLTLVLYRGYRRYRQRALMNRVDRVAPSNGSSGGLVCWASEQPSRRADEDARRRQRLSPLA